MFFVPKGFILCSNYFFCTLTGLNPMIVMEIGEHIREKRKAFGLTQVELAERLGVGIRFVRELEKGKSTVRLDKVNQVLRLFGEELYPQRITE